MIGEDLAGRLADKAGFRNLLIHGYASIIHEKVHASLDDLVDIRAFVERIVAELRRRGAFPED